jgi:3-methyladenine DNA glycosylase AlkD
MNDSANLNDPKAVASALSGKLRALPVRNTPNERAVLRGYSRMLKAAKPEFILDVARSLLKEHRWLAYELMAGHGAALRSVGEAEVEEFGQGINGWAAVDSFARILAGPAWLRGQVSDTLIGRWAHSPDRWWRRAALVSTVALNMPSRGGKGDAKRTLAVCRLLVNDHDDMVVKALSWALRGLVIHDAKAVRGFLREHEDALAGRVKREVGHKLATGLKNPRRRSG